MKIYMLVLMLLLIPIVTASEPSFNLKHNSFVDYKFICLDSNGQYCSTGTSLLITIWDYNGSIIYNNRSLSPNPTYFNISLPTSSLGEMSALIISPTTANTTTEFTYIVTTTGNDLLTMIPIFLLIAGFLLLCLAIYEDVPILGFSSGVILSIAGVYLRIYGLGVIQDLYTQTLAYVSLFIGLIVAFASVTQGLMDEKKREDD